MIYSLKKFLKTLTFQHLQNRNRSNSFSTEIAYLSEDAFASHIFDLDVKSSKCQPSNRRKCKRFDCPRQRMGNGRRRCIKTRFYNQRSLLRSASSHTVIDYVGGWDDIHLDILKTIGEPESALNKTLSACFAS